MRFAVGRGGGAYSQNNLEAGIIPSGGNWKRERIQGTDPRVLGPPTRRQVWPRCPACPLVGTGLV